MLIRSLFVTNSSSTSFICYGIDVGNWVEEAFNKSNLSSETLDGFIREKLEDISKRLIKSGSTVRVYYDFQLYYIIFYVEPSYLYLGEGGVASLPSEALKRLFLDNLEEEWNKLLRQALSGAGINTYSPPGWQIALSIER
jgi:hypothetical protein